MTEKTITITLTDLEVDALEDVLFCDISDEKRKDLFPYYESLWYKIATEFDKREETKKETNKVTSIEVKAR